MQQTFAALADPIRLRIVEALREGERSVGDLEDALHVSQPAASKHLRALRLAGVVQVRKDAQRRIYRLDPRPLEELNAWLGGFRRFWDHRLDVLERHLDQET